MNYECEYCGKKFAQVAALCQHRRKHTGVKVTEQRRAEMEVYEKEFRESNKDLTPYIEPPPKRKSKSTPEKKSSKKKFVLLPSEVKSEPLDEWGSESDS